MKEQHKKKEKRSPLKAPPLRNPGQSLDEEISRIINDEASVHIMLALVILVLTLLEWWRWYFNTPLNPIIFTIITAVVWVYVFRKLMIAKRKVRTLKQGRDGEKAVGQYLEMLREKGYRVLHDLVGEGFNVDHVLIGPAGVFTIETKTISKPAKGSPEITYDCENITVGGFTPDRDPIVQGKAQASWLTEILEESTGRRYKVQPVVLYPGWFIRGTQKGTWCEVLVLNPKALPGLLDKFADKLSQEDTKLITYHLSRYIRATV